MTILIKYPRTFHFPWSEGAKNDDKILQSLEGLIGKEVVITEKLDGENTSMYTDHIHCRSLDSEYHISRDWVKAYWGIFKNDIPENWRVCGENMYAKHSIHYTNLMSYLYGFSVWDDTNTCLSWDDTLEWFSLLGITPVPTIFRGLFDQKHVMNLWDTIKHDDIEGFVVRVVDAIPYDEFGMRVGKFVRKDHVQTSDHWMHQEMVKNLLGDTNVS